MNDRPFQVAIIGAGIGGLCLAQGLKKAGIPFAVYERDEAPSSRLQGFRIHIDPEGSSALHECLPARLWQIFDSTGGDFSQGFTVLTEQLEELLSVRTNGAVPDPIARHRSISRITLRHILLAGLEDAVHFHKRFVRYEEIAGGRFTIYFGDGSSAQADLVVGADGVNSAVRKQYLPDADPIDTGVVGVGSKVPLRDGVIALAPGRLLDGPVMVMPPTPCGLFMAIWKRSPEAKQPLGELGLKESPQGDEDYLILGLGGRVDYFGLDGDLDSYSGGDLKNVARRVAAGWHPDLRKLVEMADEREIYTNRIRTSRPLPAWKATRVTLLGDAIHSMTPYRGIGANIALKDAALLSAKLASVRGELPLRLTLPEAVAEYETEMRKYAFAAVEASRKSMEQFVLQKKAPGFHVAKTVLRVINRVPALKRRLAN